MEYLSQTNMVSLMGRPPKPDAEKYRTPVRNFRSPDETYLPARELAKELGVTITDVLNAALADFVQQHRKDHPHR